VEEGNKEELETVKKVAEEVDKLKGEAAAEYKKGMYENAIAIYARGLGAMEKVKVSGTKATQ